MSDRQSDLFGTLAPTPPRVSEDFVALMRKRMLETLDMMKAAQAMPWTDRIAVIHVENAFRANKNLLPPAEGAALWAEFDWEMDRLFALAHAAEEAAGLT